MVTAIFLSPEGVYKTSLGGRKIKHDPFNVKRYNIVDAEYGRENRIRNANRAAGNFGRVPRSEAHAAGEAIKPPKVRKVKEAAAIVAAAVEGLLPEGAVDIPIPAVDIPVPVPAEKPLGVRALHKAEVTKWNAEFKKWYRAAGDPRDAPDENTIRMALNVSRHDPTLLGKFYDLMTRVGAKYFRYNPVSHSFEMYTHRQVYKGSYQLPRVLRSKLVAGPIQHHQRKLYKGGPTKVFVHNKDGMLRKNSRYLVRPPGPGRVVK